MSAATAKRRDVAGQQSPGISNEASANKELGRPDKPRALQKSSEWDWEVEAAWKHYGKGKQGRKGATPYKHYAKGT